MSGLEKITDRENLSRRDLFKIGFVAAGSLFLPSYLTGCKNGGGSSPPQQTNNPPKINTSSLPSAEEGEQYTTSIDASDLDNDSLTYSVSGPNGMTNSGKNISWNNPVFGNHPVIIQVSDAKDVTSKNLNLSVINTLDKITGTVNDILDENKKLSGINVLLEETDQFGNPLSTLPFQTATRPDGTYEFSRIPNNKFYRVTLEDLSGGYIKHRAGLINLIRDEVNVNFELIPNSFNMDFFDEIARNPGNGSQTQKWLTVPQIYIYTGTGMGANREPTGKNGPFADLSTEVGLVENILINDIPRFNNRFTNANIQITRGTSLPIGTQGIIEIYWDDATGGLGGHAETLNGNEIIGAYARMKTGLTGSQLLYVYRQEITQSFGARSDIQQFLTSFYPATSIFDDPQTIDYLEQKDLDLGKILYKRPPGNKSVNGIRDANPDAYRIR